MVKPLWSPSLNYIEKSELYDYKCFIEKKYKRSFLTYSSLYDWSIQHIEDFWKSNFEYFKIDYTGTLEDVLTIDNNAPDFISSHWFPGVSLSFSEHIFREHLKEDIALKFADETTEYREVSWGELKEKVSKLQQYLLSNGISKGDRVVAVLNNTVDTIAIFLAVNSLGAIWSCCSPDFGDISITERFEQIKPKLLFIDTNYQYNGRNFSKLNTLNHLKENISSLELCIAINSPQWLTIFENYTEKELYFERVPFDYPIWILYSSGTTGKPKAITHRTGGNLLEHYKALALHQNVKKGENYLWYTTTGWMMWNYALSSLLCGATLCIYNGAINHNEHHAFWNFVKRSKVDHLGAGASYFSAIHDLNIPDFSPKVIGSTGSPLPVSTFNNLQEKFPQTHIISLSGGTDVCSAFLSGCSLLPVYAGKIQCRTLGSAIVAINDDGEEVFDQVGELVIKKPMPSMPLYFWNDSENNSYRNSYFTERPGVWSHGDWISISASGIEMFGRSDATLNRGGVRIGTAEIYNTVQRLPFIKDSLAISIENDEGLSRMILFIQLYDNFLHNKDLEQEIKSTLRNQCSPRHVPDFIFQVQDIPYTLSGKKLEIPIKKIFLGQLENKAVSKDIMRNPACLAEYIMIKEQFES